MTNKVNLVFCGYKACNHNDIPIIWEVYEQIADQNGLLKISFSIKTEPNGSNMEPVGVFFSYALNGLNESNLEMFNTQWRDLSTQYSFTREPTQIRYYEE